MHLDCYHNFYKSHTQLLQNRLCCYPPSNLPRIKAIANPAIVAIPTLLLPPSACASGIIDSASITSIAPAANDIAIDIVEGDVLDRKANPITDEIVPMTTATDHKETMYFLLLPLDLIP
jgi:hypothetical protein